MSKSVIKERLILALLIILVVVLTKIALSSLETQGYLEEGTIKATLSKLYSDFLSGYK